MFLHREKRLVMSVHGDDFATVGPKPSFDWFKGQMETMYEPKEAARIGLAPEDGKEA